MHELEKYRSKYNSWINDQVMLLTDSEVSDIIEIIRAKWDPGYTVFRWCGYCVAKMLEHAFNLYEKENK